MDLFILEVLYQLARTTNESLHIVLRIAKSGKKPPFILEKYIY